MNVAFLIRSLERAGAEVQLVTLANSLRRAGHRVSVAVFYGGGELEKDLVQNGVAVVDLKKTGRWDVRFLRRLDAFVRDAAPTVLYCFMPGANLAAVPLRLLRRHGVQLVWGIRNSSTEALATSRVERMTVRAQHVLSFVPDLIIANSTAGRNYNVEHGFPAERTIVVPNGIDTDKFRPDGDARATIRREWNVSEAEWLVGLVARLDPTKDHATFIRAASLLAARRADVRFVCVGGGGEQARERLRTQADELGLHDRFIWAGHRADMRRVHNGLDVACSTSVTEAFPNALAEAMACGVPCVVSNVGDSAMIVGDTGVVVPPRDPGAFALALERMLARLERNREDTREAVRRRVVEEFAVDACTARTMAALEALR